MTGNLLKYFFSLITWCTKCNKASWAGTIRQTLYIRKEEKQWDPMHELPTPSISRTIFIMKIHSLPFYNWAKITYLTLVLIHHISFRIFGLHLLHSLSNIQLFSQWCMHLNLKHHPADRGTAPPRQQNHTIRCWSNTFWFYLGPRFQSLSSQLLVESGGTSLWSCHFRKYEMVNNRQVHRNMSFVKTRISKVFKYFP